MDCQFDIKKEGHVSQSVIGPEDIHIEIKDEVDQSSSIDFKQETFPTFVQIYSEDAEHEDMQMNIKIEDDQLSSIDIKSETYPAMDLLTFEDAKFE
ncbi:hypothetical protein L9F63_012314, partial [Diploptera punctata]